MDLHSFFISGYSYFYGSENKICKKIYIQYIQSGYVTVQNYNRLPNLVVKCFLSYFDLKCGNIFVVLRLKRTRVAFDFRNKKASV